MNEYTQTIYDVCLSLGEENAIRNYLYQFNMSIILDLSIECNRKEKCPFKNILIDILDNYGEKNE